MSPSSSLTVVDDVDRRRELRGATARIATRTDGGRLALVKRPGWIAVAAQESVLATDDWRRAVATLAQRDGADVVYAVPLDSVNDEPPLEVPASETGLAEMQTELGAWDFLLYPPEQGWAIVSTSEDVAAFLGPPPVLDELLGGDRAAARTELEGFLDDEDFWPARVLAYFRSLIAAIESYDDAPDGEVVELPIDV